ncbi:hypothetical protein BLX88_26195, partial [Bacillus obstructivus]
MFKKILGSLTSLVMLLSIFGVYGQQVSASTVVFTEEVSEDLVLDYASFGKDYEINGVKVFGDDF